MEQAVTMGPDPSDFTMSYNFTRETNKHFSNSVLVAVNSELETSVTYSINIAGMDQEQVAELGAVF